MQSVIVTLKKEIARIQDKITELGKAQDNDLEGLSYCLIEEDLKVLKRNLKEHQAILADII
jgi:hypothetical protein